jgi:hypothetical protein
LHACKKDLALNSNIESAHTSDIISYAAAYLRLSDFWFDLLDTQSQSKSQQLSMEKLCYPELKDFIKKGIDVETRSLAIPLIASFYHALLRIKAKSVNAIVHQSTLFTMANACACDFIDTYCMHNKNNMFNIEKLIQISNGMANEMQNSTETNTQPYRNNM